MKPEKRPLLSENHQRAIFHTISSLYDELLKMETILLEPDTSVFAKTYLDLSTVEILHALQWIRGLKREMLQVLYDLGISLKATPTGVRWTLEVTLTLSGVSLDEIEPKRLRGYGELSREGAHAVDEVLTHLRCRLSEFKRSLAPPIDPADFSDTGS